MYPSQNDIRDPSISENKKITTRYVCFFMLCYKNSYKEDCAVIYNVSVGLYTIFYGLCLPIGQVISCLCLAEGM